MPLDGSKDIQSIRTFAIDAALMRSKQPQAQDEVRIPKKTEVQQKPQKEQKTEERPLQAEPIQPIVERAQIPSRPVAAPESVIPKAVHRASPSPSLDFSEELSELKPEPDSILSEKDDAFDINPQKGGSIIRDTKRKRFRLFPAMATAVSEWAEEKKKEYDDLMHPHHAVAKAEARKEVIAEAVKHGTQAPKEDFDTVSERLKGKKRTAAASTLTFKKKTELAEPTWTYVEDEANNPAAAADETNAPPVEQRIDETPAPVMRETAETPKESVPNTEENALPETPAVDDAMQTTEEEAPRMQEALEPEPEPEPETEPLSYPVAEPEPAPIQQTVSRFARSYAAPAMPQRFGLVLFVVIVSASLLGSGASYYFFAQKNAPQTVAEVFEVPSLINIPGKQSVALQEHAALLSEIESLIQNSQEPVQIYPVTATANGQQPASAAETLAQLSLQAPGSFTRSVREMVFGASAQKEPFLILSITSFDTAFAGMLAWEKTMSADLAPLFGDPVVESFDPSARTATQVREAFFKDIIASNSSARLLLDEKGDDRIIYTFVNQNTILITTNQETLAELLPLMR